MTLLELLVLLVIAGTCGAIGEAVCGFSTGGFVVSLAIGFLGSALGIWLATVMALPGVLVVWLGPVEFPMAWAVIGAALFVAAIRVVSRRTVYYHLTQR